MGTPHNHTLAALSARPIGYHLALARLATRVLCGPAPKLYEPFNRRLCHQKRRTPVLSLSRSLCFPRQCEIQNQNRVFWRRYSVNRTRIYAPGVHAHIEHGWHLAIIQIPDGHALCCILKLSAIRHRDHLNI